jgi:ABC-type antimicrobial peptide transport system permease subunit
MGIRMALGAQRGDVVWMVLREAWILVAIGIAVGVPMALAVGRIASNRIQGLLFRMDAADPATMLGAVLALVVVATIAAYLPARRASRVDPMIALRAE